jgi:tRNA pseudouridine65 synthase
VVIAKPSGMLVHRGGLARDEGSERSERVVALELARALAGRHVFPVHRLDRGTSGALAFALDSRAARRVHEAFERGEVDKRYLALVRGRPPDTGVIDHPVPRAEGGERVPATTDYWRRGEAEVEGRTFSLVEARPRSGRFHQIRRHLKHLGHPVIGDANYGRGELNRLWRARGLARLALHAASITFAHPDTNLPLTVTAPLPPDLGAPLAAAGFDLAWLEQLRAGR